MCGSEDCSKIDQFWANQRHLDITKEMLTTFDDDPDLLKKIITGNQSWVYVYYIETKVQTSQ